MLIDEDKELKTAILNLTQKEKDKLLFKLISKDVRLLNQLRYKLLEGPETLLEKREELIRLIDSDIEKIETYIHNTRFSPGAFMMELRYINGRVNEHYAITKDKYGDIELRLHILKKAFEIGAKYFQTRTYANEKLLIYIAGRLKHMLDKYNKLHEDYQFDLQENLNQIIQFITSSPIREYIKDVPLP